MYSSTLERAKDRQLSTSACMDVDNWHTRGKSMAPPNKSPYQPMGKYVGKRAAKYKRLSDEGQEEGYSLEFQEERISEAIALEGCSFDEKHSWQDTHTGMEIFERPGLNALRAAARRHEFDVLFLYKLDRFSRVDWHQEMMREELKRYGVRIVTLKKEEHADDDSPLGKVIRAFYGFKAEEERNDIFRRTHDGIEARVKNGSIIPSHKPLYGYSWDDASPGMKNRYIINPKEATVVKRMFDMAKNGWTLRAIARQLTVEGIPSPTGQFVWRYQSVRYILSHPFYTGQASAFRWKNEKLPGMRYQQSRRALEEQIALPEDTVPAIIDIDTFEAVQRRLAVNKQQATRNNKHPQDALLRCGLVVCGYCGRNMNVSRGGHSRDARKPIYRCPSSTDNYRECERPHITCQIIDNAVWAYAVDIIRNPAQVVEALEKKRQADPTEDNRKEIKRQLKRVAREIENCTKTLRESKNDKVLAIMSQELERLAQVQEDAQGMLAKLDNLREEWAKVQEAIDGLVQHCEKMRVKLDSGYEPTYKEKRGFCEFLGLKALVWRADRKPQFEIECNLPDIYVLMGLPIFSAKTLVAAIDAYRLG